MPKYKIKELKQRPIDQPLPVDVNEKAETAAKKIGGELLLNDLTEVKEKRWFGTLYTTDNNGTVTGKFEFQSGICTQFKLYKNMRKSVFEMNVLNAKVSLKNEPINLSTPDGEK